MVITQQLEWKKINASLPANTKVVHTYLLTWTLSKSVLQNLDSSLRKKIATGLLPSFIFTSFFAFSTTTTTLGSLVVRPIFSIE